MNSTQVIKEVIYHINGHRQNNSATTQARITAEVNKRRVVDDVPIRVMFTFDGTNYSIIDIFWEESGIKDYKAKGLFGRLNTRYAKASTNVPGQLDILDGKISITLRYGLQPI